MSHTFLIHLAVLNTFKKKIRILLALGGIALTSSVIVVLFGIQIGLKNLVDNEIRNGQSIDVISISQRNAQKIKLDDEQLSDIRSISGIGEVSESVGLYGSVLYHGISLNAPIYAISDNYFSMATSTANNKELEGEPLPENIIVSKKVLEIFGIDEEDARGKTVEVEVTIPKDYASGLDEENPTKVISSKYTIKSVIDRNESPVFYVSIDPIRDSGLTSVAQVNVRVNNPEKITPVRESIEQQGLQTSSIRDTISQINKLFDVIQNILLVFGVVVFVITVASAFTIITLTLMEETSQIGFLRIMGLKPQDVKILFYIQSMLITTLGAFLGIILGYTVGFSLNGYAQAVTDEQTFASTVRIFAIPAMPTIIILTLSMVVGWVVGIIPAKRAVLINPLEELAQ